MPDQPPQPPGQPVNAPTPVFNPVITGPIISPLERDLARQSAAQSASMPPAQSVNEPDFAQRLAAARQSDRPAPNGQPPAQQNGQQPPAAQPAVGPDGQPLLQPRSQRQQKNLRSQDWEVQKQRIAELEAQVAASRSNNQPTGYQPNGQPANNGPALEPQPKYGEPSTQVNTNIHDHPDYKALKQERDTFYEEIKHVRVEADPEFRAKFDTKRDSAIRIAKSVAGGAADDIARILAINDPDVRQSQLADRIKDFSEGSRQRIMAANAALVGVDIEREMEVMSRKASWEATSKQRDEQQKNQFAVNAQKMDREFEAVAAELSDPDSGIPFMYDQQVRARVEPIARRAFSGNNSPRELAKTAIQAALLPEVIRSYMHVLGELQRVQDSNSAYRSSYPGSDGGFGGGSTRTSGENAAITPINPLTFDRSFASGLEAARQRDAAGRNF